MHKLSWRELDTLVKILEVASMMRLKPQEVTRVSALRVALSNAMVALNQHAIPDKQL